MDLSIIKRTARPAGSAYDITPAEHDAVWTAVESELTALQIGQGSGVLGFASKALMDADLAHGEGALAEVTNDGAANNGRYRKSGASGAGSWVKAAADRVEAKLDGLLDSSSYDTSPYLYALVSGDLYPLLAIDRALHLIAVGKDVTAALASLEATAPANDPSYDLSGYAQAIVSADGYLLWGLKADGSVYPDPAGYLTNADFVRLKAVLPDPAGYESCGFAEVRISQDGYVLHGLRWDGSTVDFLSGTTSLTTASLIAAKILPRADLVFWGDSLTAGAGATGGSAAWYPSVVGAAFPARQIYNKGIGGQGSVAIAARQGGIAPLVTVTGNVIPASGAVTVTSITNTPFNGDQSVAGKLRGIVGTLTSASGVITFTRGQAGASRPCPVNSSFIVDAPQADCTAIIWIGRNNGGSAAVVLPALKAMVDRLSVSRKRFLVLSVLNGAGEGIGTSTYNNIMDCNAQIEALYPDNYVDVRRPLVESYDSGQSQDVLDFADDIPPTSKRADSIHLLDAGQALVAGVVIDALNARGW